MACAIRLSALRFAHQATAAAPSAARAFARAWDAIFLLRLRPAVIRCTSTGRLQQRQALCVGLAVSQSLQDAKTALSQQIADDNRQLDAHLFQAGKRQEACAKTSNTVTCYQPSQRDGWRDTDWFKHASQTKLVIGLNSSRVAPVFAVPRRFDRKASGSTRFSSLWVGHRPMPNSSITCRLTPPDRFESKE